MPGASRPRDSDLTSARAGPREVADLVLAARLGQSGSYDVRARDGLSRLPDSALFRGPHGVASNGRRRALETPASQPASQTGEDCAKSNRLGAFETRQTEAEIFLSPSLAGFETRLLPVGDPTVSRRGRFPMSGGWVSSAEDAARPLLGGAGGGDPAGPPCLSAPLPRRGTAEVCGGRSLAGPCPRPPGWGFETRDRRPPRPSPAAPPETAEVCGGRSLAGPCPRPPGWGFETRDRRPPRPSPAAPSRLSPPTSRGYDRLTARTNPPIGGGVSAVISSTARRRSPRGSPDTAVD